MTRQILLIAGPTASGKSALALRAARALDGEIVNADALQLYADLTVLSARPTVEEQAGVPHHLFGVTDGADGWSVGRWLRGRTTLPQIARWLLIAIALALMAVGAVTVANHLFG